MDNATLMYIVLGLLSIFFIVLMVFSAKSWRVLHLITSLLVFVAAGVLVWFTAATLRTHEEWRSVYNALTKKVAEEELAQQTLLVGVLSDAERAAGTIREAEAARQRVMMDRGRVWRGCVPEVGADSVVLTVQPAPAAAPPDGEAEEPAEEAPAEEPAPAEGEAEGEEPDEEAPPAPAPAGRHGIAENMIVYAFLEGESTLTGDLQGETPFVVPALYLGEFRVTGRTDTTITVQPTARLSPLQQASLGEGNWTIYDNMPVDAEYVFAGVSEENLRILFPQERMTFSDEQYNARIEQLAPLFEGKTLDQIAAMIPKEKVLISDAQYDQFIGQYLRDGKEADADQDPAETIWKEVKMLVPVSIQVDAVLRDQKGSTYTQAYDIELAKAVKGKEGKVVIGETALVNIKAGDEELGALTLALTVTEGLKQTSDYDIVEMWDNDRKPPALKTLTDLKPEELVKVLEAKSVSLAVGDVARVHPETAKFLVSNKLAKEEKSVYVRPLRDYAHYFNDSYRQELLFEDTANVMKQDTATLVAANQRALEQETYRADEIAKLNADREGFQREATAINALAGQVETRVATARAKLSELYKANLQLAQTIKTLQLRWAAEYENPQGEPAPTTPVPIGEAAAAP